MQMLLDEGSELGIGSATREMDVAWMAPNKKIFAVSLGLNAVLASAVALQLLHRAQPVPKAADGIETRSEPVQIRYASAPEQEKLLTLATLEADARKARPAPRLDFWRFSVEEATETYKEIVEADLDAIRRALIAKYGQEAVDDPLFARVFRPLNARFPYLSSKAQIALAKLQGQLRPAMQVTKASGSADLAAEYERENAFNRLLRNALSEKEYDEYQLRESYAARQLRASEVASSEREFREAFAALKQMDADRSAAGYLAGQQRLRDIFGAQRFAQFSASRDPQFALLEKASAKYQLTREMRLAAYGVILDAQLAMVRASVEHTGAIDGAVPDLRNITERRDQAIVSLVGEEAARDVLHAYTNGLVSASLNRVNNPR